MPIATYRFCIESSMPLLNSAMAEHAAQATLSNPTKASFWDTSPTSLSGDSHCCSVSLLSDNDAEDLDVQDVHRCRSHEVQPLLIMECQRCRNGGRGSCLQTAHSCRNTNFQHHRGNGHVVASGLLKQHDQTLQKTASVMAQRSWGYARIALP